MEITKGRDDKRLLVSVLMEYCNMCIVHVFSFLCKELQFVTMPVITEVWRGWTVVSVCPSAL